MAPDGYVFCVVDSTSFELDSFSSVFADTIEQGCRDFALLISVKPYAFLTTLLPFLSLFCFSYNAKGCKGLSELSTEFLVDSLLYLSDLRFIFVYIICKLNAFCKLL